MKLTEPTTHKAATHCGPRWDFLFLPDVRAGPLERNRKTPYVIIRSGIPGAVFLLPVAVFLRPHSDAYDRK